MPLTVPNLRSSSNSNSDEMRDDIPTPYDAYQPATPTANPKNQHTKCADLDLPYGQYESPASLDQNQDTDSGLGWTIEEIEAMLREMQMDMNPSADSDTEFDSEPESDYVLDTEFDTESDILEEGLTQGFAAGEVEVFDVSVQELRVVKVENIMDMAGLEGKGEAHQEEEGKGEERAYEGVEMARYPGGVHGYL